LGQIKNFKYSLYFDLTATFNDSSILVTIISWGDYLNFSVANEYVGDITISTQAIMYNQFCSRLIAVFTSK